MTPSHTAAPAILSYVAWQSPAFKGARVTMTGTPFRDDAEIELTAAAVADLHRDDAGTVDLLIVYGKDEEADEALISRQLLAAAAFDPARWLSDLAAQGGWWAAMVDGRVGIGLTCKGYTDAQQAVARRMIEALTESQDKAVKARIRNIAGVEAAA